MESMLSYFGPVPKGKNREAINLEPPACALHAGWETLNLIIRTELVSYL